jgi:hypothetical protein
MKAQYLVVWSGLPDEKAIWEDKEKLVSEGWEKSIEDFERTLPPEEQEVNRKKELQLDVERTITNTRTARPKWVLKRQANADKTEKRQSY